ncbi:MAG: DEAD/DEAH box helicase [Microlunatus sp.]
MSDAMDVSYQLALDVQFGYLRETEVAGPRHYNPKLVLNRGDSTVQHALIEELDRCDSFTFSVAFVSAAAIAQLKQHLIDFDGAGRLITSDFLGFNQPQAFAELLNLQRQLGFDVRRHTAKGFHPKGYVFEGGHGVTAVIGSSNLTSAALADNHEWNLKVSAATGSDLAGQFEDLLHEQILDSEPLTQEWIDAYAATYVAPAPPSRLVPELDDRGAVVIRPNSMQQDALLSLDLARAEGAQRAIIISATGTGKTILSALDVRAVNPRRMLFVVHREQILDRTIEEYRRVLGGAKSDYGKLAGGTRESDRRYVFATIQTLSQPHVLSGLVRDAFDYVIIDEAHRAGAAGHQRVIDYLKSDFLLGMTATPERMDGFNVFELFDYNVPYEIRLSHALEAEMLCPFHYYGIADVTYADGNTVTDSTDLRLLVSPERVAHLLRALGLYGQAGIQPCGLIFCSRTEEARALSAELNQHALHGRRLRTVALTGDDPVAVREQRVAELEAGELDYLLTVDIFNEGVDIPSVNQVIMLRQTQSAIIFVQQLGRGLRRAAGKDYLVVIDVIGNYTNNYLIPVALFGDDSLNKESLREKLNETVEGGALPGLSSVSFDEIARGRILNSIRATKLDSLPNLKTALLAMRHRVGRVPELWDFHRFESVDPVVLATKEAHYPALVQRLLKIDPELSEQETRMVALLSHEVLAGKRLHEFVLVELLLESSTSSTDQIAEAFAAAGLPAEGSQVRSAIDTVALRGYPQANLRKYAPIVTQQSNGVRLTEEFSASYAGSRSFRVAVDDLLVTGRALTAARYRVDDVFTPGMQYSRRDAAHLLGWARSNEATIYGYKVDVAAGVGAIFVTLKKSAGVAASTAYEDQLLDSTSMRWFSKSNRTLQSKDVRDILDQPLALHVFVKQSDADGSDHYYLGQATPHDPLETTMPVGGGKTLPVVSMTLRFREPIKQGLFDYFHPMG